MVEIRISNALLAEAYEKFPVVECTIGDGVFADLNSIWRNNWLREVTVKKDEQSEILGAPV